jgi:hypothetical protein
VLFGNHAGWSIIRQIAGSGGYALVTTAGFPALTSGLTGLTEPSQIAVATNGEIYFVEITGQGGRIKNANA